MDKLTRKMLVELEFQSFHSDKEMMDRVLSTRDVEIEDGLQRMTGCERAYVVKRLDEVTVNCDAELEEKIIQGAIRQLEEREREREKKKNYEPSDGNWDCYYPITGKCRRNISE